MPRTGAVTIATNAPTDRTGAGDSGLSDPSPRSRRSTCFASPVTSSTGGSSRAWYHPIADRFAEMPLELTPAR